MCVPRLCEPCDQNPKLLFAENTHSNASRLTEPWHTKPLFLATVSRYKGHSTLPSSGLFTSPGVGAAIADLNGKWISLFLQKLTPLNSYVELINATVIVLLMLALSEKNYFSMRYKCVVVLRKSVSPMIAGEALKPASRWFSATIFNSLPGLMTVVFPSSLKK